LIIYVCFLFVMFVFFLLPIFDELKNNDIQ